MELLAQASTKATSASDPLTWVGETENFANSFGLPWTIIFIVLCAVVYGIRCAWLVLKPHLLEILKGHKTLLTTLQENSVLQTTAVQSISAAQRSQDDNKNRTISAIEKTATTLDRIVDTQLSIVSSQNAIQREVMEHRKLQEKMNEKMDRGPLIGIQANSVEMPQEASR